MLLMETQRRLLRLLVAAIVSWVVGGCATTGNSFRIAEVEKVAEHPTASIELVVSRGKQARNGEYPTTLRIESANAPGFTEPQGSAGTCSGVLIAKSLVLTAAHCMCLQPMHSSSNKALNRSDCATRVNVMQHVRKVEHKNDGGMRIINDLALLQAPWVSRGGR
jgi:secreted trypsin-like serine protease